MDIIGKKYFYFLLSGIIIIPGLISLLLWGLNPSIDFTGGSTLQLYYKDSQKIDRTAVVDAFKKDNISIHSIKAIDNNNIIIRTSPIDQKVKNNALSQIRNKYKEVTEKSFDTVGPIIGDETKNNALKAVLIASLGIALYIAFAFREVSKPVSSWKFGICAIVALLHDVLVVVGVFSLLGHFFQVEVDSLFITALLTVMGFSVHDTIVVFDRIRENLRKNISLPFEKIINNSILETFNRSLNTSLTVALVLFTLLVFGGENIRWFVAALLIGIISGTYSSIFNASPLLVVWYEWDRRRKNQQTGN